MYTIPILYTGHRVPILVAEQGIGRGAEPTTTALNWIADGTGGDSLTTYAPKPLYMTNHNRSMIFENSQVLTTSYIYILYYYIIHISILYYTILDHIILLTNI